MFFAYGKILINVNQVICVDLSGVESLQIKLTVQSDEGRCERIILKDMDSVNFLYKCCPHALEGKRLKWVKNAWLIHNFIGHPLMQFFCFFKCYKLGMKIHDRTIPKPRGLKDE